MPRRQLNEKAISWFLGGGRRTVSPSIVFIEDIDLIGQNRIEFGYMMGPALLSLLAVMDGLKSNRKSSL